MFRTLRVVTLGVAVVGSAFGVGLMSQATAAQSCDPAYVSHCVPPVWELGDLDCQYFYDQGISHIQLADPTNDPHGLDGYDYVDDGIGCEGDAASAGGAAPAAIASSGCDPSYPEVCLASTPDLDCAAVGFALNVIHDPTIGAYDPHGFDADYDGIGCESW